MRKLMWVGVILMAVLLSGCGGPSKSQITEAIIASCENDLGIPLENGWSKATEIKNVQIVKIGKKQTSPEGTYWPVIAAISGNGVRPVVWGTPKKLFFTATFQFLVQKNPYGAWGAVCDVDSGSVGEMVFLDKG